jgi:hypothetical protein
VERQEEGDRIEWSDRRRETGLSGGTLCSHKMRRIGPFSDMERSVGGLFNAKCDRPNILGEILSIYVMLHCTALLYTALDSSCGAIETRLLHTQ